jgi:ankyrin repeat protein
MKNKEAMVNAMDEMGNTPLHFAALNGNIPIIQLLEKAGGDSKLKNNKGELPVDFALQNE